MGGGPRTRPGRKPDPNSERSELRGIVFSALPREGFTGRIPKFPLPKMAMGFWTKDGEHIDDTESAAEFSKREAALWKWAWRTPQAAAWAAEPWRQYSVAQWVRASVLCEGSDAKAADRTAMLRLADQIGMSPTGLAANGWKIADVEPEPLKSVASDVPVRRERRLRG